MPEYKTEPIVVPVNSGILPEGERNRRVALTSFAGLQPPPQVPRHTVVCYECGLLTEVPAAALSAKCSACNAHLKMTDVTLKPGAQRLTVRTLGDVTVQSGAVLSQVTVVCRHCYVNGRASGSYQCSGNMEVSCSNRMEGPVQADKLVVDRAVNLILTQGATVGVLEVCGRVTGRIVARESVILRRGAELIGTCYSPSLKREPGAVHRGEWHNEVPS